MLDYYECNFSNSLIKSWAEYSLVNFFSIFDTIVYI